MIVVAAEAAAAVAATVAADPVEYIVVDTFAVAVLHYEDCSVHWVDSKATSCPEL